MKSMVTFSKRVIREDDGQDLAEYGLIIGFVSLIAVGSALTFGESLLAFWNDVSAVVVAAF